MKRRLFDALVVLALVLELELRAVGFVNGKLLGELVELSLEVFDAFARKDNDGAKFKIDVLSVAALLATSFLQELLELLNVKRFLPTRDHPLRKVFKKLVQTRTD